MTATPKIKKPPLADLDKLKDMSLHDFLTMTVPKTSELDEKSLIASFLQPPMTPAKSKAPFAKDTYVSTSSKRSRLSRLLKPTFTS